jgi:hypothetical protein
LKKLEVDKFFVPFIEEKNEIEGSLIFQKPKTKDNEEIK